MGLDLSDEVPVYERVLRDLVVQLEEGHTRQVVDHCEGLGVAGEGDVDTMHKFLPVGDQKVGLPAFSRPTVDLDAFYLSCDNQVVAIRRELHASWLVGEIVMLQFSEDHVFGDILPLKDAAIVASDEEMVSLGFEGDAHNRT